MGHAAAGVVGLAFVHRATLFHGVGVAVDVAELVAWRKEEKEEEGRRRKKKEEEEGRRRKKKKEGGRRRKKKKKKEEEERKCLDECMRPLLVDV